jgi:hypothetical protein
VNSLVGVCMYASPDVAGRCLKMLEPHTALQPWLRAKAAGAGHYARGDLRAAAQAWRPLPLLYGYAMLDLPVDALDHGGEPEAARRLDADILPLTYYAGISLAHPREAERAAKAGDSGRARKLAQEVIDAWGVADVEVPAVTRMRALLAAGGRRPPPPPRAR